MRWERVKTPLRAFTYCYIDIYDKQYPLDKEKSSGITQLLENYMILKPGKGNGVVLTNKFDYHNAMNHLFSEKMKLKIIKKDPTQ